MCVCVCISLYVYVCVSVCIYIYIDEYVWKRHLRKRKAICAFNTNPFKFTKKLFAEEKNGVLNVPKETLEVHLQKYYNLLADTPMVYFGELNRLQPLEETLTTLL